MREKKKEIKYWWKKPLIFPESLSGALPFSFNPHAQSVCKVPAGMEMVIQPWEQGWWNLPLVPTTVPQQLSCSSALQFVVAAYQWVLGLFYLFFYF